MISSLASVSVQSSYPAFAGRAGASSASADDQAAKRAREADAPRATSTETDSSGTSAGASSSAASATPGTQLTLQEERLLEQLRQTDRQVRAHEQAHMAAGAGLVRAGVSFSYATGPDEKRYAVGGEVSIDVSRASTPQDTLVKARQIRAAALAPADPSAQDQSVAAQAASMESQARAEIAVQQREAITAQAATQFYRGVERGSAAEESSVGRLDVYA
jgi:hypothetical protein